MRRRSICPLTHDVLIDLHPPPKRSRSCLSLGMRSGTLVIRCLSRPRLSAGLSIASSCGLAESTCGTHPSLPSVGASLYRIAWMRHRMCRMMGVVSRGPVYYDLFEEFADLATQGMCPLGAPDERGHKDGWGLACFRNGALTLHMRDAGSAVDASRYYGTAWKIAKLNIERASGQSLVVMGHLRRASAPAKVAHKFSHPFVEARDGITWAFQHNGSLVNGPESHDKIDSQIIFGMILDSLDGRSPEAVAKATGGARATAIEKYGGFTSLNFMLSDGQSLHVYRD